MIRNCSIDEFVQAVEEVRGHYLALPPEQKCDKILADFDARWKKAQDDFLTKPIRFFYWHYVPPQLICVCSKSMIISLIYYINNNCPMNNIHVHLKDWWNAYRSKFTKNDDTSIWKWFSFGLFLESPPQLHGNLFKAPLAVRPFVHLSISSTTPTYIVMRTWNHIEDSLYYCM